ncbi:MAG: DHH family phosphoesterase [Candidatus Micrarchaeaceae archaeon]
MKITKKVLYKFLSKYGKRGYAIVHAQDFDGIASAALLMHYFNMPAEHIFFGKPGRRITTVFKEIKRKMPKNNLVVIADIAYNSVVHDEINNMITAIKSNGNYIAWIDHHAIDAKGRKILNMCDFLMAKEYKNCATELIYKNIIKPAKGADEYGKNICTLAHISDFNIENLKYREMLKIIGGAISFLSNKGNLQNLRKMASFISKNELQNKFIKANYLRYVKESKKNMGALLRNSKVYVFGGKRIGIGFGKNVASNEACYAIKKKTKCDISIYINIKENVLHLRSWGVECLSIARYFGGNGHPYACGADIMNMDLNKIENKKKILKEIEISASKF